MSVFIPIRGGDLEKNKVHYSNGTLIIRKITVSGMVDFSTRGDLLYERNATGTPFWVKILNFYRTKLHET